jgi:hypothetical protein
VQVAPQRVYAPVQTNVHNAPLHVGLEFVGVEHGAHTPPQLNVPTLQ